jgi:hypothetical protein
LPEETPENDIQINFSGLVNDQLVYTTIRAMPQDEVNVIEGDIEAEEKMQKMSRQESRATLVERDE